jgi:gliding motility-associated-like protein
MFSFNTSKPYLTAMKNKYLRFLLFSFLILRGGDLLAQPINDNCDNATVISNPRNYCSGATAFTNVGATTSVICLSSNSSDVWFSFRAVATDVRVTIQGAISPTGVGTLTRPEAAIYSGADCTSLSEIASTCDPSGVNIINVYKGGITPGEVYYIRVQGGNNRKGTFKLCIVNYNPPANITSDCPTSAMLCDKSTISVASVTGGGTNTKELDDATCFISANSTQRTNLESNSTWFKWTCLQSGTLTFTITPTKLDDDIDFAIYELPNGVGNCTGKSLLRCMASGEGGGSVINPCTPFFGPTGLRVGETDIAEPSGCAAGNQSNFLKPLDMVAGKTYALGINNFSSTGNGFNLEFGGTGSFVGPEAKINFSKSSKKLCLGEDIVYTDASSFGNGNISKRKWRFGKDASIDTASSVGPYRVFYKTPGWKSIVLTVTTDRGCQVTTIVDSIFVEAFKYDSASRRPTCTLGNDGMARLRVINCGRPPIRYNWDNAGYTTRDSITGLRTGTYRVAVTDSSGVYVDTIKFTLKEQTVDLDTAVRAVKSPQCAGMTNGSITLKPASGIGPYIYNWGRGNTLDSALTAIGAGSYNVSIRDANDCKGNFTFDLVDPPKVEVSVDTFNISCFGLTDGQLVAHPSGGVGNYRISWSHGALGDTARNLKAGTYTCFAYDSNDCAAQMNVLIKEPPQIKLDTQRIKPSRCYGDSTAELVVKGFGGTPPYRYSIDGVRFQRDSAFLKIPSRTYQVVVRDSTGCRATFNVPIPQPPVLQVNAGQDLDVDLGESKTLRAIVVPSSKLVNYAWTPADSTLSCKNCPVVTITALNSTIYRVTVKDSSNCMAYDDVLLRVIKRRPIYAPNVFSPNNDGINDFFTLYGNQAAVRIKSLRVFNRWGDMLFNAIDLPLGGDRLGWNGTFNGKDVPPDVFVYVAVVSFIDGEEIIIKGDVTLTR